MTNFTKDLYNTLTVYKNNIYTWDIYDKQQIIDQLFSKNKVIIYKADVLGSLSANTITVGDYSDKDWTRFSNIILNSNWDSFSNYYNVSSNLTSTYNTVLQNINKWGTSPPVNWGLIHQLSGNWDSTYTTVLQNSARWIPLIASFGNVPSLSSNWNNTTTIVESLSPAWENARNINIGSLHVLSGNWNSLYTTLCSNSAAWNNSPSADLTVFAQNTANFNSTSDTVDAYGNISSTGIPTYSIGPADVTRLTGLTTTVRTNSALWSSSKTAFKNLCINGNLDFWQRGTSKTIDLAIGGEARLADLSYGVVGSSNPNFQFGGTGTYSRENCTSTELQLFNAKYFYRYKNTNFTVNKDVLKTSQTDSTDHNFFIQGIEDAFLIRGKYLTLSFWARASGPTKIFSETQVHTSHGHDSIWTPTILKIFDISTEWKKYTHTYKAYTYDEVIDKSYYPQPTIDAAYSANDVLESTFILDKTNRKIFKFNTTRALESIKTQDITFNTQTPHKLVVSLDKSKIFVFTKDTITGNTKIKTLQPGNLNQIGSDVTLQLDINNLIILNYLDTIIIIDKSRQTLRYYNQSNLTPLTNELNINNYQDIRDVKVKKEKLYVLHIINGITYITILDISNVNVLTQLYTVPVSNNTSSHSYTRLLLSDDDRYIVSHTGKGYKLGFVIIDFNTRETLHTITDDVYESSDYSAIVNNIIYIPCNDTNLNAILKLNLDFDYTKIYPIYEIITAPAGFGSIVFKDITSILISTDNRRLIIPSTGTYKHIFFNLVTDRFNISTTSNDSISIFDTVCIKNDLLESIYPKIPINLFPPTSAWIHQVDIKGYWSKASKIRHGDVMTDQELNEIIDSIPSANGSIDIAQVQLEVNHYPTSFEFRPYGLELSLCQRYFCKSYSIDTVPGTATGSSLSHRITTHEIIPRSTNAEIGNSFTVFPVPMARSPVVTFYAPLTLNTQGIQIEDSTYIMPVKSYTVSEQRVSNIIVDSTVISAAAPAGIKGSSSGVVMSSFRDRTFMEAEPILTWHYTAEAGL